MSLCQELEQRRNCLALSTCLIVSLSANAKIKTIRAEPLITSNHQFIWLVQTQNRAVVIAHVYKMTLKGYNALYNQIFSKCTFRLLHQQHYSLALNNQLQEAYNSRQQFKTYNTVTVNILFYRIDKTNEKGTL